MEALKSCLFSAFTELYRVIFSPKTWRKIEAYATFLDYYSKFYAIIWNYIPNFTLLRPYFYDVGIHFRSDFCACERRFSRKFWSIFISMLLVL